MAVALLPDALWDLVEPFLPIPPRRPKRGRPRASDRACLTRHCLRPSQRHSLADAPAGTRVRIHHSGRSLDTSHRALTDHAPHRAWEWPGPVAVGRGARISLAQSVSPPARAV